MISVSNWPGKQPRLSYPHHDHSRANEWRLMAKSGYKRTNFLRDQLTLHGLLASRCTIRGPANGRDSPSSTYLEAVCPCRSHCYCVYATSACNRMSRRCNRYFILVSFNPTVCTSSDIRSSGLIHLPIYFTHFFRCRNKVRLPVS